MIFRQIDDGNSYKFIGECYVHGMMDGEAIMLKDQQDMPTKHFQLVRNCSDDLRADLNDLMSKNV